MYLEELESELLIIVDGVVIASTSHGIEEE